MIGKTTITAPFPFWAMEEEEVLRSLKASRNGLSPEEARLRKMDLKPEKSHFVKGILLFISQFKSPLILLLIFALLLSAILKQFSESAIIFFILFGSGLLSFYQEKRASVAAEKLRALIQTKARVKRNGIMLEIPGSGVVSGDVVILEAGDMIPCDGLLLELKDLYINESKLTGESFPSEKKYGPVPVEASLQQRPNSVFKGTNVISGTGIVLAAYVGEQTELGKIESNLDLAAEETAFEKDIKQFGYMLMRVALLLAGVILIVNIFLGRNPLDSILFALALSVGLTPEMLPAIVTITLSGGAKRLSKKNVIVKKLASIQNLGAIDILCSDKTGTLTQGEVNVHSCLSFDGQASELVKEYAYLNSFYETGFPNPIDSAIKEQLKQDTSDYKKNDEVPYDFIRKRLSVVVDKHGEKIMITKGALKNVLDVCTKVQGTGNEVLDMQDQVAGIMEKLEAYSKKGQRTLGICYKVITDDPLINKDDESEMVFLGFILLNDPLKKDIVNVLLELKDKNIELKIITGDNSLIAESIALQLNIPPSAILSGREMHLLTEEALSGKVNSVNIFAETEPLQKERIVKALQRNGHVVGYLGDGINDASALKAADVGISVDNAVDVAKESADIILLKKDLNVISDGISEGRRTYMNTLKYIFITISANFGNMLSMAGASVLLPFLPLLPSQILLINFLTDIPALAISSDHVDLEMLQKPRRWNVKFIRRFMFVFGLESSLFDFLTFYLLYNIFHASAELFHTGWFTESVITEVLILLIIRTHRSFFRSKISSTLMLASSLIILTVLIVPHFDFLAFIGLTHMPMDVSLAILLIIILYGIVSEITKKMIFRKLNY